MTSHSDDTREGKGRVRPGPSPSLSSRGGPARGRTAGLTAAFGALVLLVATVVGNAFGTQAHQYSSPAALAIVAAFGSFLGVVIVVGLPRARAREARAWLGQAAAGAGGLAIAPWLVMANRYTDAPPGSETLFFSVTCWGAMLAAAAALSARDRLSRIGGALLALGGTAAVVANWERPSSFSPLVRYASEELFMLAAGVLWVALVLVLLGAARRSSLPSAALNAALGGVAGGIALAGVSLLTGSLSASDFAGSGVWAYGVATGLATASTLVIVRSRSASAVAGAYLLVPSAMSLLLGLESVFGSRGPNPLLVEPIVGATVIVIAGAWLAWEHPAARADSSTQGNRASIVVARIVAAGAVAAALLALVPPGPPATVQGLRADSTDFRAVFDLYGFEVAGAWLALGVAVAALGLSLERPAGLAARWRALAFILTAAAWPFVAATPLRTLTRFIPSDVQVDYGSEFARIDFAGGPPLLAVAALGGAIMAVAVTLFYRAPKVSQQGAAEAHDREVASP